MLEIAATFILFSGHCVVDQTEKGWFVTYIDRDWEAIKRQEELSKKEKMDLTDDERAQRFIEKQIQRAAAMEKDKEVAQATELMRDEGEDSKVTFALGGMSQKSKDKPLPSTRYETIYGLFYTVHLVPFFRNTDIYRNTNPS